jgi:hypothetical protein
MDGKPTATQLNSDLEFVRGLRECVARYIQAIDDWEAEYRRFYRLARPHQQVTPDLEQAQHQYTCARRELETCIPRARRLCLKFDLRDPWPGLLRIELGAHAPQVRAATAFGRSERIALEGCLSQLVDHCAQWDEQPMVAAVEPPQENPRRTWLGWLRDLFYP